MRIGYCEDEKAFYPQIETMVQKWAAAHQTKTEIIFYGSGEELLFENPESFPFDLLMIDIQMKKIDGLELARKIRQRDEQLRIAFLTARKDYVFQGYEVQAIRYLLKPLQYEELVGLLDLVQQELGRKKRYLLASEGTEKLKIDLDTVRYAESDAHYMRIYADRQKPYMIKKNMKK